MRLARFDQAWAILLLGGGLGLLALLICIGILALRFDERVEDARSSAQATARMLAEHAGRVFDASSLAAERAASLVGERSWDEIAASAADHFTLVGLAERLDWVSALWLIDETGTTRLTSREHPAPRLTAADRETFQVQRDRDAGPFISRPDISPIVDAVVFTMSRRINGQMGLFRGTVSAVMVPDYFSDFYATVEAEYPLVIELFRDDLSVLVHHPPTTAEKAVGLVAWEGPGPLDLDRGSGTLDYVSVVDGAERIGAYQRVSGFPVFAKVGIARADVVDRWWAEALYILVFTAATLAAIAGVTTIAWRRAKSETRALRRLRKLSKHLDERVRDRTAALEQALAGQQALVKEINHRVKNSLQLVSSLLSLQASQSEDAAIAAELGEAGARVKAIAQLHENLYRGDKVRSVDLSVYLDELCGSLGRGLAGTGPQIRFAGNGQVEVATDVAVSLALVVNELVTNALKYAFPNETAGVVTVSCRRPGANGVEIRVADDGVGLPPEFDASDHAGFGLRIVGALLQSLQGRLTVERLPRGSAFVINAAAA